MGDMNAAEFASLMFRKKHELEIKIAQEVARLCDEFTNETGISINSVSIDRIEVTVFSDTCKKFTGGPVSVGISLL